jgi:uncharacterized coiled-coil protein SlyX
MSLFTDLPFDVLTEIIEFLPPFAALQLRQTSKHYNRVVMSCQTYWYQHFTFYLIKQHKRVALFQTACPKTHKQPHTLNITCLDIHQEEQLAKQFEIPVKDLGDYMEREHPPLDINMCTNAQHYTFEIPKHRRCIPIESIDYHPLQQTYIYRFLIHNYRRRREKTKRYNASETAQSLKRLERLLAKQQADIDKTRKQIDALRQVSNELKQLKENTIFFNTKSRLYPK